MKRVLLTIAMVLLIPGVINAQTMGVYFDGPGQMAYSPSGAFVLFDAYIYLHEADYYVTGAEYQLQTPEDPEHTYFSFQSIEYPDNMSVNLGDPWAGHSISYWPPLNGYEPGYNLLLTLKDCYITGPCDWTDYPIVIGPHPANGGPWIAYTPDNELALVIGYTSILCPVIGTQEESWGAIKSMYE